MRFNRKQRRSAERPEQDDPDDLVEGDGSASRDELLPSAGGAEPDDEDFDEDFDRPLVGASLGRGSTLVDDRFSRTRPTPMGESDPASSRPREFLHEVNVELRKVVWPTRQETINYSSVVLVTLAVLMALIFGLDDGFSHLASLLFGN